MVQFVFPKYKMGIIEYRIQLYIELFTQTPFIVKKNDVERYMLGHFDGCIIHRKLYEHPWDIS